MKRQDLLTNEEFTPLRINQKFANAENRIKFHNKKANAIRHSLYYINKPLYLNFIILSELLKDKDEAVFHKEFLKGKGYDLTVQTHIIYIDEIPRPAVYCFAIIKIDKENVKILKTKDNG